MITITTIVDPREYTPEQLNNINVWLESLRSGKFDQTNGVLKRKNLRDAHYGYCCLGVACEVNNIEENIDVRDGRIDFVFDDGARGSYPQTAWFEEKFGFRHDDSVANIDHGRGFNQSKLAGMNDVGVPFGAIASVIEAYVKGEEITIKVDI